MGVFPLTFYNHPPRYLPVAWGRGWSAPTPSLWVALNLVGGMRFPAPVLRHISNAVLAVQNQSSGFARQITPILIGSPDYHSVGEALLLRVPGQFSLLPPDPRKQINAALPWVCILELMMMFCTARSRNSITLLVKLHGLCLSNCIYLASSQIKRSYNALKQHSSANTNSWIKKQKNK